jgi:cell division cycle 20, cofactor of APC complex
MATVAVCTPIKGRVFTTKTAGGRMPLTPSPKANRLFDSYSEKSPSIHVTPTFIHALPLPNGQKSVAKKSAKSNIALPAGSPKRLDGPAGKLGAGDWTLTAAGTPSSSKSKRSRPLAKSTVRIAYNASDRFMPNRTASDGLCNLGESRSNKMELELRPKSSGKDGKGSSILSSAAAGAFGIGGRGAEDDILAEDETKYTKPNPEVAAYESTIAEACGVSLNTRILAFKPAAPESSRPINLRAQYSRPLKTQAAVSAQLRRRILTSPERVLDAPEIMDDYYLNVLDWSCNNQVAIGLNRSVYVWSADSGGVCSLLETDADCYISSLKWSSDGAYVSVGLSTGEIQVWDVEDQTKVRSMFGHESRVSSMSKFLSL